MGRYSTGGAEALAAKRWGGAPLRTARVWCRFNAARSRSSRNCAEAIWQLRESLACQASVEMTATCRVKKVKKTG